MAPAGRAAAVVATMVSQVPHGPGIVERASAPVRGPSMGDAKVGRAGLSGEGIGGDVNGIEEVSGVPIR